ncbi:MAG: aldo/keto reductase [Chitinophagaceae bacterium]|nr:MAG: aldo/keto reductase [Chitinophagaceae bacterium]
MADRIKIGNSALEVARLNLGGNVFGWTLDEKASFEILDAFTEAGYNFVDTADTYSWWVNGVGGQSETIIGKWMKDRRNRGQMLIATKVGSQTKEHPVDISRKHILKSIDASLKRLQTDHIDLYYTHFDDGTTPVEETMATYDEIIKAGKVKHIAASNVSPSRLQESFEAAEKNGWAKYIALQPHYNLVERAGYEKDYAPIAAQYGLTVFPYWALAAGFLTGKYRTEADLGKSVRGAGVQKYMNDKGLAVLAALDKLAEKHETKPATIAIAWLLAQPNIGAPIASATSKAQLNDLIAAEKLKTLPISDLVFSTAFAFAG